MTIQEVIVKYRRRWKHVAECRRAVARFAERLNATRKKLKQTHEQFALDNGIATSRIFTLCQGTTLPHLEELEILLPIIGAASAQ